jgi:alpha-1,6-mannosyl-glycoprotein beta-1,2-N-acetylglucosaminyltransferase
VIIVVQVHNRVAYLRHLISSLSLVTSIHTTLIIFSLDIWDEQINTLVRSIDFTATLQIFYPYSLQTHPNIFPGTSPSDCPRDGKTTKK